MNNPMAASIVGILIGLVVVSTGLAILFHRSKWTLTIACVVAAICAMFSLFLIGALYDRTSHDRNYRSSDSRNCMGCSQGETARYRQDQGVRTPRQAKASSA
jgi:uncharacterized membrane protein